MQKPLTVLALTLTFFSLTLTPVMAMDITIQPDGSVYFYNSQVLGDSDENESEVKESEPQKQEKKSEDKSENKTEDSAKHQEEQRREEQKKQLEVTRESAKKATEQLRESAKPLRVLPKTDQNQIRLKAKKDKTEVVIEQKRDGTSTNDQQRNRETMETSNFRLELPANNQRQHDEPELETENEPEGDQMSDVEEVRRERASRKDDKIEIQSETHDDGQVEFQFESRNVKAKLKGADLLLDPATNNVTVTSPDGTERTLVHLPDQALEKMQAAGVIDETASGSGQAGEIELETNPEGRLMYKLHQTTTKRLFGLIPRQVEIETTLDDLTSEVRVNTAPTTNPLTRLLNALSL